MPRKADTQIRVSGEVWSELNTRKRPGDSFDDVLRRLIEKADQAEGNTTTKPQTAD